MAVFASGQSLQLDRWLTPASAGDAGDYADLAWVRRHRVQTRAVWERPSIVTRALCKLGMKRRFVCTFEWLT